MNPVLAFLIALLDYPGRVLTGPATLALIVGALVLIVQEIFQLEVLPRDGDIFKWGRFIIAIAIPSGIAWNILDILIRYIDTERHKYPKKEATGVRLDEVPSGKDRNTDQRSMKPRDPYASHEEKMGARGERKIAKTLERYLVEKAAVINDVMLPTKYATVQIDHVVITPWYVVAVETKNWNASVEGQENDPEWRLTTNKPRQCNVVRNPLLQVSRHAEVLSATLESPVDYLLVFVGKGEISVESPKIARSPGQLVRMINEAIEKAESRDPSPINVHGVMEIIERVRVESTQKAREKHNEYARKAKAYAKSTGKPE